MAQIPDRDHYEILGVSSSATASEIKHAYRKRALELHPDRRGDDPSAREELQRVQESYAILDDPAKKREYDMGLGGTSMDPVNVDECGVGTRIMFGMLGKLGFAVATAVPPRILSQATDGSALKTAQRISPPCAVSGVIPRGEARFFVLQVPPGTDMSATGTALRAVSENRGKFKLLSFRNGEVNASEDAYCAKSTFGSLTPKELSDACVVDLLFADWPGRLRADCAGMSLASASVVPARDGPSGGRTMVPGVLMSLSHWAPSPYSALSPGEHLVALVNDNLFQQLRFRLSVATVSRSDTSTATYSALEESIASRRDELASLKARYMAARKEWEAVKEAVEEEKGAVPALLLQRHNAASRWFSS